MSTALASEAARAIRGRTSLVPHIGLILGSGLGGLAGRIANPTAVPYADIPNFPRSAVEGHTNELILGQLAGRPVVVMSGRVHMYEGYSAAEVAFPVRVLRELGIASLLVSNAAGGLNRKFQAGDLMLIEDHIFLPGLAGHNPLTGPNDDLLGPRFPGMVGAYDAELRRLALEMAAKQQARLHRGTYIMVAGPSYETAAEYRALRAMGADAVGMSTCPEVVVARHMGLRVLGISLITNVLDGRPVSHEEVLATARAAAARFCDLVEGLLGAWP
jgi:purine-nucleoside phosphorylase